MLAALGPLPLPVALLAGAVAAGVWVVVWRRRWSAT
jgi:hypothetical protein